MDASLLGLLLYAHTNSVGFIVNNTNDDGISSTEELGLRNVSEAFYYVTGNFSVTVCYGSWHSSLTSNDAEGALALYVLDASGALQKAYGQGGIVASSTAPFRYRYDVPNRTAWGCSSCTASNPERRGFSEAHIEAVGFAWGSNYFYSDASQLWPNLPTGASRIYMHQCATLSNVHCPATYKIDYDDTPVGATAKNRLTQNFDPTGGINAASFTILCNGTTIPV